ncbi:MAG: hypothetical protein JSW66_12890 [Phycisphaerales bacterium]|nr:MAG: hypothetical protein JSW66_12890 [Phycisphaerales bacterium]
MKNETLEKLASLERELSDEKGDFSLFGLFLREDAQDEDKWDILVAAPWLDADKKKGLAYLAKEIQERLEPDELLSISRIVVLERGNPTLEAIHKAVKVKHGKVEIKDNNFSGVQITKACISTSATVDPIVRR